MCYNFQFLSENEIFDSFSGACIEAEKSLVVSNATTAILTRRALELAVKWVFSFDEDLEVPYRDNLATLIHDYTFNKVIDERLFPQLKFIQSLGNVAVHSNKAVRREQAVRALENLFDFVSWIDYSYSDVLHEVHFDKSVLHDQEGKEKSVKELKDLDEKLRAKDKKLEDLIKENQELRKQMAEKRVRNTKNRDFEFTDISEYETRKLYIDLALQIAGWTIGQDCIEEVPVKGMPNASGDGYVDYVLYGDGGKPLAVVEAKRASKDPKIGKHQARLYADCIEASTGFRPVIFYTNGFEYNILDDVSSIGRTLSGFYTKDDLNYLIFKREHKSSLKEVSINDDITNRGYQKMAIQAVCDTFEKGHRKALLVMATGSGKTRTAISLVDVLSTKGWTKNVLFLADRKELVKQAKISFKDLLKDLSICNLLNSKEDPNSRMIFSTYPTMMNAIDSKMNENDEKLFSVGHFDLIIIDESHRSIYKKYQAIFDYFDAHLVGLTATPKNDISKNTYSIFGLEDNVPTFAYELDEAIEAGYLVPYYTRETTTKFLRKGINYDELSPEDQEAFEETFDTESIREINSEALNKFLFNSDTVDKVLRDLMTNGIKIEGGDKLAKTIIFAKNTAHAEFIVKRFEALYPEYKDGFTQPVYNGIRYVDDVIERFKDKEQYPQVAVSVDMLDTGIDVPEIANLVFFKRVMSKSKFWQMIGRGTRTCKDLFGVGQDKTEFVIFDYCDNFNFFRENEKQKEAQLVKKLSERIFNIKSLIAMELQHIDYQEDGYIAYRKALVESQLDEIGKLDESAFEVRMHIEYVHMYLRLQSWEVLEESKITELESEVSPIILSAKGDELARRFDLIMYSIQYAMLKGLSYSNPMAKVIHIAERLAKKGHLDVIRVHKDMIKGLGTQQYWETATILDHEAVRCALRDLISLLDYEHQEKIYTNFTDEVIASDVNEMDLIPHKFENYEKKVNSYLESHRDDIVVYKLRNNKELVQSDIRHLEDLLWKQLGTKEEYEKVYQDKPLLELVSHLVGLEPIAANELFSEFINDKSLNSNQMEFVKLIVTHVIRNGSIDKHLLREHPFNKHGSITKLFESDKSRATQIIEKINSLNNRINIS